MKLLPKIVVILLFITQQNFANQSKIEVQLEKYNYVVKFKQAGLLYYAGDVNGLQATKPSTSATKLLSKSTASKAYSKFLTTAKNNIMEKIRKSIGSDYKEIYHYKAMYHGVLLKMTEKQAESLKTQKFISSVEKEPVLEIVTDHGPQWINANQIWDGSATPYEGLSSKGEGIIVGVIDTGINPDHPSFAQTGPVDNYQHINPFGNGSFIGHCIGGDNDGVPSSNPLIACNNKLIGAWAFSDPSEDPTAPLDNNGHGSHTAGTAAGNTWQGPFYDVLTDENMQLEQISGVAPHANIIAYDVCEGRTCSATSAGIDRAILDGVDVINFSISGGSFPWGDNDRRFLDAVNAGIFIAASSGNTGEGNSNPIADANHLGPWLLSVAASTHNRNGNREIGSFTGGASTILENITGQSNTGGYGPAPIVYAGDFINGDADPEQCLSAFPENTWTNGEIVLCDRGAIARVLKGANVLNGGAGGYVLGNVTGGDASEVADFHALPGIHINLAKADEIRNWLASGSGHMAEIINSNSGSESLGDVLAGFSLRGPNLSFDVTKPNITAPGVSILAADVDNPNTPIDSGEVGFKSGTSMSSPHIAGSGALLKAILPTWSVAEINSAIQMTADLGGRKENNSTATDADDVGSGRIDLSKVSLAGLVMDETFDNFVTANPDNGGDPKTLNIPSVRNSTCGDSCQWTRVLKNKLTVSGNWEIIVETDNSFNLEVSPMSFSFNSNDVIFSNNFETVNGSQLQTIVITASSVPTNTTGMAFGYVTLREINGNSPDLHIPVAVNQILPYGGVAPSD